MSAPHGKEKDHAKDNGKDRKNLTDRAKAYLDMVRCAVGSRSRARAGRHV
jgi:hypothetical protein